MTHPSPTLGSCIRRLVPLSLVLVLVVAAVPGLSARAAGEPAPVLDQSFTSPGGFSFGFDANPITSVAQTFTAGKTGLLSQVSVDIVTTRIESELRVEIMGVANGLPNGNVLGSTSFTTDQLQAMSSGSPLSERAAFTPAIYVTAGTQYALVASYGGWSNTTVPHGEWGGATGDAYSSGSAFVATDVERLSWQPLGADLHFQTYVITDLTYSDLKITRISGPKSAPACHVFKETYRVTNLGPDPAQNVFVGASGTDQFDVLTVNGQPGAWLGPFALKPGESRTITVYFKVTAFVPGESRNGEIGVGVGNDVYPAISLDLHPENNVSQTQFHLVGKPKLTCP